VTRLEYTTPASTWLECLPLGNGSLGAMIDGGLDELVVYLNHEHGWSGSPASEVSGGIIDPDAAAVALAAARDALRRDDAADAARALQPMQARYSQAFLPLGQLRVKREARGEGYVRSLDLETSIHRVTTTDLTERAVTSAPLGVLAVETSRRPSIELTTELAVIDQRTEADDVQLFVRFPSDVAPPHEESQPAAAWDDEDGGALRGVILVRTRPSLRGWLILLAAETTFEGHGLPLGTIEDAHQRALARLDRALLQTPDEIFRAAADDHRRYFDRARVRFGRQDNPERVTERLASAFGDPGHPLASDPGLAALLFDYGRYLLISSSRPGGVPPTLQGVWNRDLRPMWSSNYTLNINLQMNYWSAHSTHLSELTAPLLDFVEALAHRGAATARRLYAAHGWTAHHNSDLWGFSSPVGRGVGDARWVHWPLASAWLIRSLWDAVEFGAVSQGDLERMWAVARGTVEFILDWHHWDGSGWSTSPSTSPENTYIDDLGREVALDTGSAMDDQLIRDACEILGRLAALTGHEDDAILQRCAVRLRVMPQEPSITAHGIVREWSTDRTEADPQHRHLSSLYGLFPGNGQWSDEVRHAAVRTLERRGDESTGWSLVWKIFLWARLGRADKVSDVLALVFREADDGLSFTAGGLYPNLFAAHPPFQIDANLAFPGAIAECLLQSHDGIHLLPAVPAQLADGSAVGLIARPGVEVDLEWADGDLVKAALRSAHAVEVELRYRSARRRLTLNGSADIDAEFFAVDVTAG